MAYRNDTVFVAESSAIREVASGLEIVEKLIRLLSSSHFEFRSSMEIDTVADDACDAELRGTFDFFDADGDGRITAAELLGALRAVGDERCTLQDCRRMIASVDGNGTGSCASKNSLV